MLQENNIKTVAQAKPAIYIIKLPSPPWIYAMGLIGGWGDALNCVYSRFPAASMRIYQNDESHSKLAVSLRNYIRMHPCYPTGRRNWARRTPEGYINQGNKNFLSRLTVVHNPSCSISYPSKNDQMWTQCAGVSRITDFGGLRDSWLRQ